MHNRTLREEVWFKHEGNVCEATWGMMVKYAYDYSEDERVFGYYTDEKIWEILEEVGIQKMEVADYFEYIEEIGSEEDVTYWAYSIDEDDPTVYEMNYHQWLKTL